MRHGYIRLWKTGPSLQSQQEALAIAKADPERIWQDDQRPSRRRNLWTGQVGVTVREQAINSLRSGDVLVVSCASILGNSAADVLQVLSWIDEHGGNVFDASGNREIIGISMAHNFSKQAVAELAGLRTLPGRRELAARRVQTGPATKPFAIPYDDVLAMWQQPSSFQPLEIAAAAKIGISTLYLRFKGVPRSQAKT